MCRCGRTKKFSSVKAVRCCVYQLIEEVSFIWFFGGKYNSNFPFGQLFWFVWMERTMFSTLVRQVKRRTADSAPLPMLTVLTLPAGRVRLADPWTSFTEVDCTMLTALESSIPAPAMTIIRPEARRSNSAISWAPCRAVLCWPLVRIRRNPRSIMDSRESSGSFSTSNARWNVQGVHIPADCKSRRQASSSIRPSAVNTPNTKPSAPASLNL